MWQASRWLLRPAATVRRGFCTQPVLVPPLLPPKLMPFQKEGVRRLVDGPCGVILADEMGLGKTPQAICALKELGAKNVLIVCPKTVLTVWAQELSKWLGDSDDGRWLLIDSKVRERLAKGDTDVLATPEILLVNYDLVHKLRDDLDRRAPFDVLIADEAHYLKSPEARRLHVHCMCSTSSLPRRVACMRPAWVLHGPARELHVHYTCTTCTLHVHRMVTARALHAHCMGTACALHGHRMVTASAARPSEQRRCSATRWARDRRRERRA